MRLHPTLCRLAPAAVVISLFAAMPALGQSLNEDAKFTASDAALGDLFGSSVAISGSTAIIGAPLDDDAGSASGSAYLFNTTTGLQIRKLTASDAAAGDLFGFSVAISGTIAIVGAYFDDDAGSNSGSAYLFDTTTGQQIAKLTASDAATGDLFGLSVAISGTTAIVGAAFENDAGSNSGSAYLFNTTTGQQIAKLTASDAAAGDLFGFSVAISGTIAIVGTYFDDDAGSNSGSAYLFDTTTGQQIAKLTASDAAAGDEFGFSVAISGTIAIIGAIRDDDGGTDSGSAYLFDTTTGMQIAKLTASDGAAGDQFGRSVAISGTFAIAGAYLDADAGTDSGSAYLFRGTPTIVAQPQGDIVDFGATANFQVNLANPNSVNYQWRRNGVNLANGGNISGSNTATLRIVATDADIASYDCVITRWGAPGLTERAVLAVLPDPDPCFADFNNDGILNFFDVNAFINAFNAGCP